MYKILKMYGRWYGYFRCPISSEVFLVAGDNEFTVRKVIFKNMVYAFKKHYLERKAYARSTN